MKNFPSICAILVALVLSSQAWAVAETTVSESIAALKSADESARIQAVDDLGALGPKAATAVKPLTALLGDKSAAVRAHAAHALGEIGDAGKPSVPALVKLAADSDAVVRRQAVRAVLTIRPGPEVAVPLCVKLLEDSDPGVQHRVLMEITDAGEQAVPGLIFALENDKAAYWACIILREMGPTGKAAIPALASRLNDPNPEIRREAVLALGGMGEAANGVIPQLSDLLADDHAAVAATFALGRIGNLPGDVDAAIAANAKSEDAMLSTTSLWVLAHTHPEDKQLRADVTEQLIARLSDDDPYVRLAAARGLAALPPEPEITLPIWEKALQGADETMMAHALDALARLGAPAVPAMSEALQYEELRPHVMKVLHDLGPDAAGASPALAKLVNDPNEQTAHEATHALARIGPGAKVAVPVLVEALKQKRNPNAHAIVYALGEIGPAAGDAQDELTVLVGGSNQDLALISAWALTKINPSPAVSSKVVPVFIAGLASPKPTIRRGAAESLGHMGKNGKAAVSALERALKDTDESVRDAAKRALALVRG